MQTRWLALAVLAACSATTTRSTKHEAPPVVTSSAATDPDTAPLPLWSEIHKSTLPNGLTYYVLHNDNPKKRAALSLAVNAGSLQEDEDQRGFAHFCEYMAFKGTAHFSKSQIVDYFKKSDMRPDTDIAGVKLEETVFQLEVPTDDPAALARALDLLRDWASDVSFDALEVEKARVALHEEWQSSRNAAQRLSDKLKSFVFAGTRYAERYDPLGRMEVIDHASRDALLRFYKDWYRADNMAVIAVGDFDPAVVEAAITKRFGDLPRATASRTRMNGGVPRAAGPRVSIEVDAELPGTDVTVANLVAHRPLRSRADIRHDLVAGIYAGILNERLLTIARRADTPFVNVSPEIEDLLHEIREFSVSAMVTPGKADVALRALLTEMLRIKRHGVTKDEFERERAKEVRRCSEAADAERTQPSRAHADEITRNFFTSELIISSAAAKEIGLSILASLGVDDLTATIHALSDDDDRVVLISGRERKALPTEAQVRAILAEVGKAEIGPWHE